MSTLDDDLTLWLDAAGFADAGVEQAPPDRGDDPWGDVQLPVARLTPQQRASLEGSTEWLADLDDLEAGGASSVDPPTFVEPGEGFGD